MVIFCTEMVKIDEDGHILYGDGQNRRRWSYFAKENEKEGKTGFDTKQAQ